MIKEDVLYIGNPQAHWRFGKVLSLKPKDGEASPVDAVAISMQE